ncbi:MAG TPA: hypothetical protein VEX18_13625, partial [Polyangiaceae bacterium]|nr:hypothetical protein [Polyangiaceae bacterium]
LSVLGSGYVPRTGGAAGTPAETSGAGGSAKAGQGAGAGDAGTGCSRGGTGGSASGGKSGGAAADGDSGADEGGSNATGGTGGIPDLPSVDPETNLRDLTDDEKAELCDWDAETLGGYGKRTTCSDGSTVQNYTDQAQCISFGFTFSCLTVTVGDVERCTIARIPSGGCDSPSAECGALYCIED